ETTLPPGVRRQTRHRLAWVRIFVGGLGLWLAAVVVTFLTGNSNLVPTVILLGSFLVPVTFVAYAFEHRASDRLTEHTIFVAFVYGGVLGVLGASLLEVPVAGQGSLPGYLGVGLIEEGCKLAALWLVARRLGSYEVRDGVALGAAVGFGFAAFETAGYAFNALFTIRGLSLGGLIETEVLRGVLAPVGHGLWTGILGGVLFYGARGGRLRLSGALVGWYLVVSALHAFWDASGGIAALLVLVLTADSVQAQLLSLGRVPAPTSEQMHLFTVLTWSFLVLDAAVGLTLLWVVVRRRRA
ncbi:MAG TPA: PrsW family glutamic-type intramembrane protease, partial [Candidatus Eisenbacteria bacterium]|nr:PrsW family glutamic-type intramembrane protease [Candidatus Eisenbacteria bacterium]